MLLAKKPNTSVKNPPSRTYKFKKTEIIDCNFNLVYDFKIYGAQAIKKTEWIKVCVTI